MNFPDKGKSREDLLKELVDAKSDDLKWQSGRSFCLVYDPGEEYAELVKEAYNLYFTENALNPTSFPSLRRFEAEVVSMMANLLHGNLEVTGSLTSGGTESILMAIKTARDYSKKTKGIDNPEIILPITAHPAFEKAFHYFGIKGVHIPVDDDYLVDTAAIKAHINPNTIMIVGSAPAYPHGGIDPISEMGKIAIKHELLFHVDACIGGMMLPFLRELGHHIPSFDFLVPGVTSISADLHKYGYAAKGASVILYKNKALRKFQFSVYTKWPGGVYGSPTIAGSKPGGAIAAAWAALNGIGKDGYLKLTDRAIQATLLIRKGIEKFEDFEIMGEPKGCIIAFNSPTLDMYQIADELNLRGWNFERLQRPPGIHLTVSQTHLDLVDDFLDDLSSSVEQVKKLSLGKINTAIQTATIKRLVKILPNGLIAKLQKQFSGNAALKNDRTAAMYGMMGVISGEDLDEIVLDLLDKLNGLDE